MQSKGGTGFGIRSPGCGTLRSHFTSSPMFPLHVSCPDGDSVHTSQGKGGIRGSSACECPAETTKTSVSAALRCGRVVTTASWLGEALSPSRS